MRAIWTALNKWETWIAFLLIFGFFSTITLQKSVTKENEDSTQCVIQYLLLSDTEELRVIRALDKDPEDVSVPEFCTAIDEMATR